MVLFSQRKYIYISFHLWYILYSKPTLLRQVVTNMLWKFGKRTMANILKHAKNKKKQLVLIVTYLLFHQPQISTNSWQRDEKYDPICTLKHNRFLEIMCDLSASQSTTGTVCGIQTGQGSVFWLHCAILSTIINLFKFALKIVFIAVIIKSLFSLLKTMNKCTFDFW